MQLVIKFAFPAKYFHRNHCHHQLSSGRLTAADVSGRVRQMAFSFDARLILTLNLTNQTGGTYSGRELLKRLKHQG